MSGRWDNSSFIEAFTYSQLGRKRQYGNLYVVDRENGIQFLMKKSTTRSNPSLEAMSLPVSKTSRISIWAWRADDMPKAAEKAGMVVRSNILGRSNIDFTDSRVVDVASRRDGHKAILIWVAGEFWLWDWIPKGPYSDERINAKDWLNPFHCTDTPILYRLKGDNFINVADARASLMPQEIIDANAAIIQDRIAVIPTKETIPEIKDIVDLNLAATTPWPWDYGIPEHICKELLNPHNLARYGLAYKKVPPKYKAVVEKYVEACKLHIAERDKILEKFPLFETTTPINFAGFEAAIKCLKAEGVGKPRVLARAFKTKSGDLLIQGQLVHRNSDAVYAECRTIHKVVQLKAEILSGN
jgi:hypothetical protein